uniref:NADH-ubiquinone oxidoreductase chain 3 n=1 Tax=Granata lyrata TaxID=479586 RepID=A0A0S1F5P0_GRALY|nr:NADH dehydrogenase subunit 3 [Granata lyrata]ALK03374.1 NADH dehydrogenase subunit 3 [Granata lyrata]
MSALFLSSIVAILVSSLLMLISWALSKRSSQDRQKASPFECGFDPMSSARLPFSLRFFLLAVIFLIFDVEIVLLFPAVSLITTSLNLHLLIGLLLFLLILMTGLLHEWREGSLDWMA